MICFEYERTRHPKYLPCPASRRQKSEKNIRKWRGPFASAPTKKTENEEGALTLGRGTCRLQDGEGQPTLKLSIACPPQPLEPLHTPAWARRVLAGAAEAAAALSFWTGNLGAQRRGKGTGQWRITTQKHQVPYLAQLHRKSHTNNSN